MGKILTASLVCLAFFQNVHAQSESDPAQEIRVGSGFLSDVRIIAAFAETYTTISSGISGDPQTSDYSTVGPVIAGYNFHISRKITVGPEFNFVQLRVRETYSSGEIVHDNFAFVNLSGRFDFHYGKGENIQMYSGICLGPSYIFDRSSDPERDDRSGFFLSYQLNFFGIRFGKEWGGYAEFGFGRNGLLSVGISRQW